MTTSSETPDAVPVQETDEVRADISGTRAELADTIDHLKAKLDVKNRARGQVAGMTSAARDRVDQAKQRMDQARRDAPEPVQQALERTEAALGPVAKRARPYRTQIALAVVSALLVTVLVRRLARG